MYGTTYVFAHNWRPANTDGITDRQRDRETDRQTDRQRHELKTSWLLGVPPKGLEARAFTFGGTEGSMLGRRGWFDAVTKSFDVGKKWMV